MRALADPVGEGVIDKASFEDRRHYRTEGMTSRSQDLRAAGAAGGP
jgi:hypothetical protein